MQEDVPWGDLKLALTIARAGTLAGAARSLGINHATVFRRLRRLEAHMGVALFERDRGGYTPTVAGERMRAAAARMESEARGLTQCLAGHDPKPYGTVRLTTTDTLLVGPVSPMLSDFRRRYPDIALEVAVSNSPLDLTRRHADMAIRPIDRPPDPLVAHALGHIAMAVYGPAERTVAHEPRELTSVDWIGLDDTVTFPALAHWMDARGVTERCVYRIDSVLGMLRAAAEGIGHAALPCYLADAEPKLVRATPPIADLATRLWLLVHPDLRRAARIRALRTFLIDAFAAAPMARRLAGTSAGEGDEERLDPG